MDPERWQQIQRIVDELFDTDPADLEVRIALACEGCAELEREVRSLLMADAQAGEVFENLAEPADEDLTVTIMQVAKTFDQYQIVRKIGVGGMGVVYQALDNRLDRYIALKFLSPKLLQDQRVRQRFVTEAKALSRIDHHNICVIYDIGEAADNQLYFTMPYYEGEQLQDVIAKGRASTAEFADYAIQICSGLNVAHQRQILHRDIKPANIFLTREGVIKILDFGIAKILDTDTTVVGAPLGSTSYMSPEQTQGQTLSACADIWSFGVVLYEMFTGELPFVGESAVEITQAILTAPLPLNHEKLLEAPPLLSQIIAKALQRDIDRRYTQMADMLWDLRQLQHQIREQGLQDYSDQSAKSHPSQTEFCSDTLKSVEKVLLELMGPVAKVMIKRSRKKASSMQQLCELVADSLDLEKDRHHFLTAVKKHW